jgi:flagellar basal-body rod modification protein FlgD
MATIGATTSQVTSAITGTDTTASAVGVDKQTIAGNFQTFLQLLTTQLKNQNPLEPLDTNQFTQQLVQFAQVEQQLKSNDQLATLVSLQKTAQSTAALEFVGQTVSVDGPTAPLVGGKATWLFSGAKPSTLSIAIKSASGQTVYSTTRAYPAGNGQPFVWDGKDSSGHQSPDGNYTISISAEDANGLTVPIGVEIEAKVDAADLSTTPPTLTIAGKDYTLDKIKRIRR